VLLKGYAAIDREPRVAVSEKIAIHTNLAASTERQEHHVTFC
jgi:hypothetical protein